MLAELVANCQTEGDLFGPEGVFTKLKGAVMERLLEAEMTTHLGREPHERGPGKNRRNGHSAKTVTTDSGQVQVRVPRDREGSFEPQLVKKHQGRLEGFDDKVLALYARGMTTRDIQGHLRDLYGTDVSHELISKATESALQLFREWQSRPLESVYPIVYLDALFVSTRDGGQVTKRAFYIALGVSLEGRRDVLGVWAAPTEGAKFWLTILTELKNRGVDDIFFVCADGLSGLDKAIEAAFPRAVMQTCIVHLIRAALRFVSWADRRMIAAELKPLYNAESEDAALAALEQLEAKLGDKYPSVVRTFRNRWEQFVPFLSYPEEIRRMLYTTNAVESLNSQLRKMLRNRGPFPNEDAVFKVLFLAIRNAKPKWRASRNWNRVLSQLDIFFEGRLPA
ncbi:MAG: IS256 family transposase [bacterium]|nr:IS256 family transposase [bacterium]